MSVPVWIGVFWGLLAGYLGFAVTVSCDRATRIVWMVAPAFTAFSGGVLLAASVGAIA